LLRETPLNFAEESNTPLICSGFLGWYTPNNGKYQRSSFSCNGGWK
jgi:hypothetical protein